MGNTKCPVCGKSMELQTVFCLTCGFERRILPNDVSGEVQAEENECIAKAQEFENERIAKAQEFYETYKAAKSAADNAKAAADNEMQSKLDEANEALAKEQTAHNKTKAAHEETKSDLATEQTAHNKTMAALKKEKTDHEETKSDLATEQTAHNKTKAALKKEKTDHEETMSDLAKEQTAHKRTQDALKYEEAAHEETKKKLDDAKKNLPTQTTPTPTMPTPPPRPNKKVIGKALFTQGGRSEAVDLYEGVCRVTAPAWTNIRGELFEIQPINDIYILRDLIGNMCDRNNRRVSSKGVPASHGDCFTIGELVIRLTLPEFL